VKTSLADYPGEVAAVLFTAGCNLACPYCHNPELVHGGAPADFLPRAEIEAFLRRRAGVLTGVCITGGEPLLHAGVRELVGLVHELGLKVKLDTNGMLPDRLKAIPADAVALDLKLAPERYLELGAAGAASPPAAHGRARAAARSSPAERIRSAVRAVRAHAAAHEFRTTVVPGLVRREDIEAIVDLLEPGERYVLAAFRPGATLDPAYAARRAPEPDLLEEYASVARSRGVDCVVRDYRGRARAL
jgi:pyruvate formate lyase activating enzyme